MFLTEREQALGSCKGDLCQKRCHPSLSDVSNRIPQIREITSGGALDGSETPSGQSSIHYTVLLNGIHPGESKGTSLLHIIIIDIEHFTVSLDSRLNIRILHKHNMSNSNSSGHFNKLIAGASAGLLESLTTYPTEYVKTRQQLPPSLDTPRSMTAILAQAFRNGQGVRTLYSGASSFCTSNAAKSAVRFFVFDKVRSYTWRDPFTGKWSAASNLLAGLVAGAAEGVFVVTFGETLKTKMIENRTRPKHEQFCGVVDAVRRIIKTDGPSGLYRGVVPVTLKQSSNAMVRFTSYNAIFNLLDIVSEGRMESIKPVLAGASAGVVTVYATMPFDSIKTRLQATHSPAASMGTFACLTSMIRKEGIKSLWRGTTPRLMRLTVSQHCLNTTRSALTSSSRSQERSHSGYMKTSASC